eukprot:6470027-Amphidinium_carterae.1
MSYVEEKPRGGMEELWPEEPHTPPQTLPGGPSRYLASSYGLGASFSRWRRRLRSRLKSIECMLKNTPRAPNSDEVI